MTWGHADKKSEEGQPAEYGACGISSFILPDYDQAASDYTEGDGTDPGKKFVSSAGIDRIYMMYASDCDLAEIEDAYEAMSEYTDIMIDLYNLYDEEQPDAPNINDILDRMEDELQTDPGSFSASTRTIDERDSESFTGYFGANSFEEGGRRLYEKMTNGGLEKFRSRVIKNNYGGKFVLKLIQEFAAGSVSFMGGKFARRIPRHTYNVDVLRERMETYGQITGEDILDWVIQSGQNGGVRQRFGKYFSFAESISPDLSFRERFDFLFTEFCHDNQGTLTYDNLAQDWVCRLPEDDFEYNLDSYIAAVTETPYSEQGYVPVSDLIDTNTTLQDYSKIYTTVNYADGAMPDMVGFMTTCILYFEGEIAHNETADIYSCVSRDPNVTNFYTYEDYAANDQGFIDWVVRNEGSIGLRDGKVQGYIGDSLYESDGFLDFDITPDNYSLDEQDLVDLESGELTVAEMASNSTTICQQGRGNKKIHYRLPWGPGGFDSRNYSDIVKRTETGNWFTGDVSAEKCPDWNDYSAFGASSNKNDRLLLTCTLEIEQVDHNNIYNGFAYNIVSINEGDWTKELPSYYRTPHPGMYMKITSGPSRDELFTFNGKDQNENIYVLEVDRDQNTLYLSHPIKTGYMRSHPGKLTLTVTFHGSVKSGKNGRQIGFVNPPGSSGVDIEFSNCNNYDIVIWGARAGDNDTLPPDYSYERTNVYEPTNEVYEHQGSEVTRWIGLVVIKPGEKYTFKQAQTRGKYLRWVRQDGTGLPIETEDGKGFETEYGGMGYIKFLRFTRTDYTSPGGLTPDNVWHTPKNVPVLALPFGYPDKEDLFDRCEGQKDMSKGTAYMRRAFVAQKSVGYDSAGLSGDYQYGYFLPNGSLTGGWTPKPAAWIPEIPYREGFTNITTACENSEAGAEVQMGYPSANPDGKYVYRDKRWDCDSPMTQLLDVKEWTAQELQNIRDNNRLISVKSTFVNDYPIYVDFTDERDKTRKRAPFNLNTLGDDVTRNTAPRIIHTIGPLYPGETGTMDPTYGQMNGLNAEWINYGLTAYIRPYIEGHESEYYCCTGLQTCVVWGTENRTADTPPQTPVTPLTPPDLSLCEYGETISSYPVADYRGAQGYNNVARLNTYTDNHWNYG